MVVSLNYKPRTFGEVSSAIDLPINKWWEYKSSVGAELSWQKSYERLLDSWMGTEQERGRMLTAEEATRDYGISGILKFDAPIREGDADRERLRMEKLMEMDEWREAVDRGGFYRGAVGFAAELAGTMFNSRGIANIDFGISALPIFGVSSKTATLSRQALRKMSVTQATELASQIPGGAVAGLGAARAAASPFPKASLFQRPLTQIGVKGGLIGISEEAATVFTKYPTLSEVVLNATTSTAAGEIVRFIEQKKRGEETQYISNVAAGAIGAAALHGTLKGIGYTIKKSAEAMRLISPESHRVATEMAAQQAATGDSRIDVTAHFSADENVLYHTSVAQYVDDQLAQAAEVRVIARSEVDSPAATANQLLIAASNALDALKKQQELGEGADVFRGPAERLPGETRKQFRARRNVAPEELPEPVVAVAGGMDAAVAYGKIVAALERIKGGDRSFDAFRDLGLLLDRVYMPEVTQAVTPEAKAAVSTGASAGIEILKSKIQKLKTDDLDAVDAEIAAEGAKPRMLSYELELERLKVLKPKGRTKELAGFQKRFGEGFGQRLNALKQKRADLVAEIRKLEKAVEDAETVTGINKKELESHVSRFDALVRPINQTLREKAIRKLIRESDPRLKAETEVAKAAVEAVRLAEQIKSPEAAAYEAAKGDMAAASSVDDAEIAALKQEFEQEIKSGKVEVPEGAKPSSLAVKNNAISSISETNYRNALSEADAFSKRVNLEAKIEQDMIACIVRNGL